VGGIIKRSAESPAVRFNAPEPGVRLCRAVEITSAGRGYWSALSLRVRVAAADPRFGVTLTKEMLRVSSQASSLRQGLVTENRSQSLSVHNGDVDQATLDFRTGRTQK
jgi:hypothetical protein